MKEQMKFNKNYVIAALMLIIAALMGIVAWQFQVYKESQGLASRAVFAYGSVMVGVVGSVLHKFKKYAEDRVITKSEWEDLAISAVTGCFAGLVVVLGVMGWNVTPEPAVYGVSFLGGFSASSITHGIFDIHKRRKRRGEA